ncbi:YicC family protein [Pseudooceanicola sp. 216_PA32_1]|uniref:YicC family protein n=1 Tax=Pseudooceanicola pacificus TaxID=2676438 RepID=A0A844W2P7_9RHOB|nr:YicC/YloC family endoribonuclease [Pseudooceanicola pacificus]MWB77365.1 YicC family protein [Pseudooceanicola pacificus]
MTGFATGRGTHGPHSWSWELRSVNARGLDLRLRLPDWIPGLEMALRGALNGAVARGSVSLNLRITREEGSSTLALNEPQATAVLDALARIEELALDKGMTLAPSRAADVLGLRGVLEASQEADETAPLLAALIADFAPLLEDFLAMRRSEGAALNALLSAQMDQIGTLSARAGEFSEARRIQAAGSLRAALARVMEDAPEVDEQRVAQELALLAVKADVTEELDRLGAHLDAARELLAAEAPVGRKLDFLTQEFNREANTLCSKSQNAELTRVGLELKAVIDQFREQVQNVE